MRILSCANRHTERSICSKGLLTTVWPDNVVSLREIHCVCSAELEPVVEELEGAVARIGNFFNSLKQQFTGSTSSGSGAQQHPSAWLEMPDTIRLAYDARLGMKQYLIFPFKCS